MSRVKQKNRVRRVRRAVEAMRSIPDQVAQAVGEYDAKVRKINGDEMLSDAGKRQQLQKARREVDGRLAELRKTYERSREEALSAVGEAINPPPQGGTQEQLLTETRAERRWQRAQRALDNSRDPADEARRQIRAAAESGDVEALRVLQAELPDYLRVVADDSAIQVAHLELEQAFGQVDEHVAEALSARRVIEGKGHATVATALNTAEEFLDSGTQATIPSWPDEHGNVEVAEGPSPNYAPVPAGDADAGAAGGGGE